MPILPERELIEKAVGGDTAAFRTLVEKHQAFAVSLSYRFVGNMSDAEDITQEAFIRLWRNLSSYRYENKLTTWLYTIISNLCLDFLKSQHGRSRKLIGSLDGHYLVAAAPVPDQEIMEEELRAITYKMKDELTPKQRAVLFFVTLRNCL